MTNQFEVYKCKKCGNIVYVLYSGEGSLMCCEENMKLLQEGVSDGVKEKHVPVIEKVADGYKVSVGAVPHPMEDAHYIQWLELIADDRRYLRFMHPGQAPVAEFCVKADKVSAREYCNLHGHWKADL